MEQSFSQFTPEAIPPLGESVEENRAIMDGILEGAGKEIHALIASHLEILKDGVPVLPETSNHSDDEKDISQKPKAAFKRNGQAASAKENDLAQRKNYDTLAIYSEAISQSKALSPEEEKELVQQILPHSAKIIALEQKIKELETAIAKCKDKEKEDILKTQLEAAHAQHKEIYLPVKDAVDKLCKANLRLVITIAGEFKNLSLPFEDKIQAGMEGLRKGCIRFKPSFENKLCTYINYFIRKEIQETAYANRTIKGTIRRNKEITQIRKVQRKLLLLLQRPPTDEEIAAVFNQNQELIEEARSALFKEKDRLTSGASSAITNEKLSAQEVSKKKQELRAEKENAARQQAIISLEARGIFHSSPSVLQQEINNTYISNLRTQAAELSKIPVMSTRRKKRFTAQDIKHLKDLARLQEHISLDEPPKTNDGSAPYSVLALKYSTPATQDLIGPINETNLLETLSNLLTRLRREGVLDPREEGILRLHFGFGENGESLSLQKIGDKLGGLSRARIHQLVERSLKKIRNFLDSEGNKKLKEALQGYYFPE